MAQNFCYRHYSLWHPSQPKGGGSGGGRQNRPMIPQKQYLHRFLSAPPSVNYFVGPKESDQGDMGCAPIILNASLLISFHHYSGRML